MMLGLQVFESSLPWLCPHCDGDDPAHLQPDENGVRVPVYTRRCVPLLVSSDHELHRLHDGRVIPLPEGITTTPLYATREYRQTNPPREQVASGE